MAILVTGGAGYIGSGTVELLKSKGEKVIVLDSLARGHRAATEGVEFVQGQIADSSLVEKLCRDYEVTACVHFAAYALVGESVQDPKLYYHNNDVGGLGLVDGLIAADVKQLVFSSTCATYGEPKYMPLDEKHPQDPVNPYGRSKWIFEQILKDYDAAYGLKSVMLRYFNAAGAVVNQPGMADRGEDHQPEAHLIPLVLQVALGQRESIQIFGTDYPTPDGTAIRDYIHILDLGDAHLKALAYLKNGGQTDAFNLGNGEGYSVREVIKTCEAVVGKSITVVEAPRRAGDPSRLIANAEKARTILNWETKYPKLEQIVESAWAWHSAHPHGYGD